MGKEFHRPGGQFPSTPWIDPRHPKGIPSRGGPGWSLVLWILVAFGLILGVPAGSPGGVEPPVPASSPPRRLVSLAPSLTEMVFALGAGDRLVGADRHSDYPPEAQRLPRVGSYIHPDVERIAALRPDLVLAVRDGTPPHIPDRLRSLGIPVFLADPRTLEGVIHTIEELGGQLGVADRAAELARDLTRRLGRIREMGTRVARRPRVFFQIGVAPIVSVGHLSLIHELIHTAGGHNVAAGTTGYPRFSREQVLALQPEVIIITTMERQGGWEDVKAEWERWPELPAARNGRIHLINSDVVDRPGPRLLDGLELLFRLLHPELAGEIG